MSDMIERLQMAMIAHLELETVESEVVAIISVRDAARVAIRTMMTYLAERDLLTVELEGELEAALSEKGEAAWKADTYNE